MRCEGPPQAPPQVKPKQLVKAAPKRVIVP